MKEKGKIKKDTNGQKIGKRSLFVDKMQLKLFAGNKEKKARPSVTSLWPGVSRPRSQSVLTGAVANSVIFRTQTRKVGLAEVETQTSACCQRRPCPSQRLREAGTKAVSRCVQSTGRSARPMGPFLHASQPWPQLRKPQGEGLQTGHRLPADVQTFNLLSKRGDGSLRWWVPGPPPTPPTSSPPPPSPPTPLPSHPLQALPPTPQRLLPLSSRREQPGSRQGGCPYDYCSLS